MLASAGFEVIPQITQSGRSCCRSCRLTPLLRVMFTVAMCTCIWIPWCVAAFMSAGGNSTQSFSAAREYLDAQFFLKADDGLRYSWLRGMQNLGDGRQIEVLSDRLPYEEELTQLH